MGKKEVITGKVIYAQNLSSSAEGTLVAHLGLTPVTPQAAAPGIPAPRPS